MHRNVPIQLYHKCVYVGTVLLKQVQVLHREWGPW